MENAVLKKKCLIGHSLCTFWGTFIDPSDLQVAGHFEFFWGRSEYLRTF